MSEIEETLSRYQFAIRLRRLADAVESGNPFTIGVGSKSVRVPPSAVRAIVHEREGEENELEFQLSWKQR
ncbi:MAG: amphi-Trp domain-containing protein [Gemmatimonadota bacterium]|nr:amphi-Trp domain-containing protein [Gemmatimonadota bacterium]